MSRTRPAAGGRKPTIARSNEVLPHAVGAGQDQRLASTHDERHSFDDAASTAIEAEVVGDELHGCTGSMLLVRAYPPLNIANRRCLGRSRNETDFLSASFCHNRMLL